MPLSSRARLRSARLVGLLRAVLRRPAQTRRGSVLGPGEEARLNAANARLIAEAARSEANAATATLAEHGRRLCAIERDTAFLREVAQPLAKWIGPKIWLALVALLGALFGGGYLGFAQLRPELRAQSAEAARREVAVDTELDRQRMIDEAAARWREEWARQVEVERIRQLKLAASVDRQANTRNPTPVTSQDER